VPAGPPGAAGTADDGRHGAAGALTCSATRTGETAKGELTFATAPVDAATHARHVFNRKWRHRRLPPKPASVALAQDLVSEACEDWRLPTLRKPAMLIVSELTTNALRQADTNFDVTVSFTNTYTKACVRIAVRDGSTIMPHTANHRGADPTTEDHVEGLHVVAATATSWDARRVSDGKIVWAILRTSPPGSRRDSARPTAGGRYRQDAMDTCIAPRHTTTNGGRRLAAHSGPRPGSSAHARLNCSATFPPC
jgi:hypothetical protein